MNLSSKAFVYIPNGVDAIVALQRTTHLAIGAHPDDLEIMSYHGIQECYDNSQLSYTGIVVCDGAGSPRKGRYAVISDKKMVEIRQQEQVQAAKLGRYGALIMLQQESKDVKNTRSSHLVEDLLEILSHCRKLKFVYTHNLADKHDTHVAVALKSLIALRKLPKARKPKQVLGCEVWRDLDWLSDSEKIPLGVSKNETLARKLCAVHKSQVQGGKRYDLGTIGRRNANATFFESHATDRETALTFAMDLTALMNSRIFKPEKFVARHISKMEKEILSKIRNLSYKSEK